MKKRTICVRTKLQAPADVVWEKLQQMQTLQYIAWPLATFKPLQEGPMVWRQGEVFKFNLKLFGIFSFGTHTIDVVVFDGETKKVYTQERNRSVPLWNHCIVLKQEGNYTDYCDKVEIGAGWKTAFVALWAGMFYHHRQRRWRKLLRKVNG